VRARRVVLAIGRRGTPRRLPIEVPPAWADRVHYSLADARSFAGQRVLVVGLGDVAMESAVALSRQAGTRVAVSYRGRDFRRGKARNIEETRRRALAGALRMCFDTEVARFESGRVILRGPAGETAIDCDAVLVMIGTIPPVDLLVQVGLIATPQIASAAGA
jgi:thioredoxin reductase